MKKVSLISLAYQRAGLVLGVMILSMAINLWVIHQHIHHINIEQGQRALDQYAQNISQQLQFYRNILKQLARQSEAQDILLMNDTTAAQAWAKRQQQYLPHNIGLALVGLDGNILGTPVDLRLGPSCVADLHKKISHQTLAEPLVHRDNPQLAHFDLTEPVTDSLGQELGALFVSFSLESLQTALTRAAHSQETLILRDGSERIIAQAGATSEKNETFRHEIGIPESTWRLTLIRPEIDNAQVYLALSGTHLVTSILIIALFVTITISVLRLFISELDRIKTLLNEIHAGEPITASTCPIKETEQILPVIQAIAHSIQDKQTTLTALSLTDELTQLPNRRRFNMELERACNLSQRGVEVALLIIDVDRFKQINDNAGHAVGDRVIQLFAECLQHDTRKTDLAARLGGDEFAVLATNMHKDHLAAWVERLRADFQTALQNDSLMPPNAACTFSVGVAFAECAISRNPLELLRRADQALYRAKENGRDRCEIDQTLSSAMPN